MESRPSGRADGRGWGGRGDSAPRRAKARGDSPQNGPRAHGARGEEASRDDDLLRGPGDAPWVRAGEPGPGTGERSGAPRAGSPLPDLSTLLVALEGMRGMVPRELTTQVNALLRELLLTLRAVIDWYLERLDGPPDEPQVEEIPID